MDNSTSLATYPELKRYLLEYPKATLPGLSTFFYWQEASFGLKRTIHLSHVAIVERPQETVVMSKMLYATHYFWSALDLRVLVPDPARGTGFWFVTASRSRLDGLSGFTGFFVRRRVRSQVQEGAMKILMTTKRTLEGTKPLARSDTHPYPAGVDTAFELGANSMPACQPATERGSDAG